MVFVIKSFYLNRQLVRSSEKYGCRDIVPAKLQTKLKKQKLQKKIPMDSKFIFLFENL